MYLDIICYYFTYVCYYPCVDLLYLLYVFFISAVHPWGRLCIIIIIIISYLSVRVVRRSIDPFVGYDVLSYYSFPIIWLMPCPVRFSGRTGWGVTCYPSLGIRRFHVSSLAFYYGWYTGYSVIVIRDLIC